MIVRGSASLPPALRPFVKMLWFSDESARTGDGLVARERVLPTGTMSLVFRISDHPLRLFDAHAGSAGRMVGHAIVGGARTSYYVRDVSQPTRSVGAQLHPGAAELLLGAPAGELAERHTRLDELWGHAADEARERLALAGSPETALDVLQTLLIARMPKMRGIHPAVAHALARFATTSHVNQVVNESGYCHRRFIALFRESVGLAPKIYCRVLRFQTAIDQVADGPEAPWASLATESGYSDQAHFTRDFRAFAGVTPGAYRRIRPAAKNHVPIDGDQEPGSKR